MGNGINSDIVDNGPNDWLDLESNFDLDAEGVYNNNEPVDAFVSMTSF